MPDPAQVTLSELKDYMVHLRSMPNISRHATLAEMVKRFMVQPTFVARVHAEQDLLSGAGPDACCDFIEVGSVSNCGRGLHAVPSRAACQAEPAVVCGSNGQLRLGCGGPLSVCHQMHSFSSSVWQGTPTKWCSQPLRFSFRCVCMSAVKTSHLLSLQQVSRAVGFCLAGAGSH